MTRRDERRTAARDGILAAAHRQIAEGGCASASVAAVAARAGIAAGSLYRHFPSRSALLGDVVGDALRGERRLLAAAVAGLPPREALAAWVRLASTRALQAPVLTHALLVEPADPVVDAVRRRERKERETALAEILVAGTAAGAWPPGAPRLQAAAIGGALEAALVGPAAAERLGAAPVAAAEADGLVAFVLGAVGAP